MHAYIILDIVCDVVSDIVPDIIYSLFGQSVVSTMTDRLWVSRMHVPPSLVGERRAYPAPPEREAWVRSSPTPTHKNVPSFRRWRFEMKLSPLGEVKVPVSIVLYIDGTYLKKGIPIRPVYRNSMHISYPISCVMS